ncbi:hypothetical protein HN51_032812, partial [Arachis hypogaea]
MENFGVDGNKKFFKDRDNYNHQDGIELSAPHILMEMIGEGPVFIGMRMRMKMVGGQSLVKMGRYAPVSEVHEVDDEVLPILTLENLKYTGII